jgi:serine/threonine protein kinase
VTLPSASFAYIVRYLGSFEQNRKFTVILEYAEGGSLLDFFKKNQTPTDKDQLVKFWTNILDLLLGLNCIHEMSKPDGVVEWVLEG